MNKKGIAEPDLAGSTIYWMIVVFIISGIIISFIGMMASYSVKLRHVPEGLEAEMISLRFLNNPDCFTYRNEENGRVYPSVIDFNKFTQERMSRCYKTEEDAQRGFKQINFGLELEGKEVVSNNFGGREDFTIKKIVYVKKENLLKKAILIIKVQEEI